MNQSIPRSLPFTTGILALVTLSIHSVMAADTAPTPSPVMTGLTAPMTFSEVTTNLTGPTIFVDASLDGTLVNATDESQKSINAGDSTGGNWGRVDSSCHAQGTTSAGHTDALRANVLEGNTPAGLPDLKWTFKAGTGDGSNGGGNLKPSKTYKVYALWLKWPAQNGALTLANNASFTGADVINSDNCGTNITSGTRQDWYRFPTKFSVTTDANGVASLWIRQPANSRTIFDGVVLQEVVEQK